MSTCKGLPTLQIKSVLEFRNQEILHKQNAHLQRIAEQEAQEAKAMAELTTWMYNDSRATRIATIIAMIYLPANIVFVSTFSWFLAYQQVLPGRCQFTNWLTGILQLSFRGDCTNSSLCFRHKICQSSSAPTAMDGCCFHGYPNWRNLCRLLGLETSRRETWKDFYLVDISNV